MGEDELLKWVCLFECIDLISRTCEERNLDSEEVFNERLKPSYIKRFITERHSRIRGMIENNVKIPEQDTFLHGLLHND